MTVLQPTREEQLQARDYLKKLEYQVSIGLPFRVSDVISLVDKFYNSLELGYRYWFTKDSRAGFVSEDSEPTYNQGNSHKLIIGLTQNIGGIKINGRLSLIVPEDSPEKIQYLAVTQVSYDIFYSLF